ncbi:MAG: esterase/lipase family protein, partial [Steroidobacteraceae bacterium]
PRAAAADLVHLDPRRHRGRTAVLLVHGYFCNAGFWHDWRRRGGGPDRPHVAVSLGPAAGSIDRMTCRLDAAIRRVHDQTGVPVVIVAHSLGGLVVRAWWRQHASWADAAVARVVTLGSPHRGTALAAWAMSALGRAMRTDSVWLRALATDEPPGRAARFLCCYTDCDNVVFPPHCARLPGAPAHLVSGAAHIAMASRPAVHALVDRVIDEAEQRRD